MSGGARCEAVAHCVRGLCAYRREVAKLPGGLDPPGHEVACLPQVTSHLRGDPKDVQRIGASGLVVGVLNRPERLLA
jgi:hypothetical protein